MSELEDLEISLLLEGICRHYGIDFRDYAYSSLKRRIGQALGAEELRTVSGLQERVLHDPAAWQRLLLALSIKVTAMFRDPSFYLEFRRKVVPILRTYPFLRIWHAGCSTGEEVLSMAILLEEEEGLYDRCRIYATDLNEDALARARTGILPLSAMQEHSANYLKAGGTGSLSDFYTAGPDVAVFRPSLRRNVVFARHNLATDGSFNDFHVILCRNVMIYFNATLRTRVHRLLHESLVMFGVLGLGNRESLRFTPYESAYEELDSLNRLYRKVRPGD